MSTKRYPMMRVRHYEEYDEWCLERVVKASDYHALKPAGEITLAELIEWHSAEAENANHHDQTKTAERLAALITKHAGAMEAHAVLLDIAEVYGGVHQL